MAICSIVGSKHSNCFARFSFIFFLHFLLMSRRSPNIDTYIFYFLLIVLGYVVLLIANVQSFIHLFFIHFFDFCYFFFLLHLIFDLCNLKRRTSHFDALHICHKFSSQKNKSSFSFFRLNCVK